MALAFDTLKAARAMVATGLEQHQAEAIASAIRDVQGDLVTKADISVLRSEIRSAKFEMRSEMQSLKSEMRSEIRSVKSEMQPVESSLKSEMRALNSKMQSLESTITSELRFLTWALVLILAIYLANLAITMSLVF